MKRRTSGGPCRADVWIRRERVGSYRFCPGSNRVQSTSRTGLQQRCCKYSHRRRPRIDVTCWHPPCAALAVGNCLLGTSAKNDKDKKNAVPGDADEGRVAGPGQTARFKLRRLWPWILSEPGEDDREYRCPRGRTAAPVHSVSSCPLPTTRLAP